MSDVRHVEDMVCASELIEYDQSIVARTVGLGKHTDIVLVIYVGRLGRFFRRNVCVASSMLLCCLCLRGFTRTWAYELHLLK